MQISEYFPNQSQVRIQKCRLYLQVVLLSDVCTADGGKVEEEYYHGRKKRESKIHWPEQGKPDDNSWA